MTRQLVEDVLLASVRSRGPLLVFCSVPGCSTLTMGGTCVEHDPPRRTTFPRGRPYVAAPDTPPIVEESLARSPA